MKRKKGVGIATFAALGLGLWILSKFIKEKGPPPPKKVPPDRVLVPEIFPYLAPREAPYPEPFEASAYLMHIRKGYYDDFYERGTAEWQKIANAFWKLTEGVTDYNRIYPIYERLYRAYFQQQYEMYF